jgi:hypothetical protein
VEPEKSPCAHPEKTESLDSDYKKVVPSAEHSEKKYPEPEHLHDVTRSWDP